MYVQAGQEGWRELPRLRWLDSNMTAHKQNPLVTQTSTAATASFRLSSSPQKKSKTSDLFPLCYPTPHPFKLGRELPLSFPSTSTDSLLLPPLSFAGLVQ